MMSAFYDEMVEVVITRYGAGSLLDGEFVPGEASTATERMAPIPITPAQAKLLPEGKYKAGDMKFYAAGAPVYRDGDIFQAGGSSFKVGDIMDRSAHGNYTIYFTKRME